MKFVDFKMKYGIVNIKKDISNLRDMPSLRIRCGTHGGLPFETLMTDILSGCLPINNVCYGNCTACDFWVNKGYNFGNRTKNYFDKDIFINDVKNLPKNVKWLRQGWISDCSFSEESWRLVSDISEILAHYSISLLIITKVHRLPSPEILKKLAKNNAEIRVSLSAFDTKTEHKRRFKFLKTYKKLGGKAIPYVMTALFNNKLLTKNQKIIINKIIKGDYLAAEHPLRINVESAYYNFLAKNGFNHPKFNNQYWFGRILYNIPNFVLPPPTHLPDNYTLMFKSYSTYAKHNKITYNNLPTYEDLKKNPLILTKEMNNHAAYIIQKH